jgi:hypothetical protein
MAGDLREKFRIRGPDAEEMFILHRHASRNQTLGMVGRELLVEVRIPAQLRQVHTGVLIESFMTYSLRPSPVRSKADLVGAESVSRDIVEQALAEGRQSSTTLLGVVACAAGLKLVYSAIYLTI